MMNIQEKINNLSAQKRELLVLRNPLSSSQQRIWFTEQLGAGGAVYNLNSALRLEGRVETAALKQSLNEVVRRHDALRTTFFAVDGQPIQIVNSSLEPPLLEVDLSHLDETEQQVEISQLLRAEAIREFDLINGPLLRFTLVRLHEDEHIFQLTAHHMICDGWSLRLFFEEMAALYDTFRVGQPSQLNEPAAQYGALVQQEQQWIQSEAMDEQIAYWREQLEGMPSVLELPADQLRSKSQSFQGAFQNFTLSSADTETLKELSRQNGITLFTTLLAIFKVFLSRLTGQEDIVVGSPVANRNSQEFEEVIGLFINILVMRTDLSGDPSFVDLLQRVRQTVLGAQEHQELPFDRLVEALQPERDLSHAPIVQVLFVQLVKPPQSINLPGLVLKPQEVEAGTMRFDLSLSILEMEDGLGGRLEYDTNLFEPATASRLVQQFQTLISGVVLNPDQRISQLPLLTGVERHQLLVEWQDTYVELDEDLLFLDLFEQQVESAGDRVALLFEELQLTYSELNRRSNQLARHLRQLGIGPGSLVALYLDRSPEMLVSLLAVLKTGAAYVPLDPGYPRERLKFILEDSRVAVMVTQEHLAQEFSGDFTVVSLERDWEQISRQSEENLATSSSAEFLAYVIYTSGSTGKPKGVGISHCALINFLQSMRREPKLTEQDSLLAITTLSFDIAALELLLPLMVGARVIIASRADASDGTKLAQMLVTHGITIMQATPATWQLLIDAGWRGEPSLKMLCGGDTLTADLAAQLLSRGASLWNLYGPTETAIWSAAEEVVSAGSPVPIGRPIANTEIHILDRSMLLLPVGVPGEIYIGGLGLSHGYSGRPELTAEKFVPNSLSERAGERLYRTGDLARRLPDGSIEFLGRIDYQVKLRGFRIELGEIESVLTEHQAVRETVVVVQENVPGDKRLVAFVVPEEDAAPSATVLREFLNQKLPSYMVPPNYVVLASLPRTANGKIDRRALTSLEFSSFETTETFVAPRTPIEEEVARIWAEILKTEEVGIFNNFFELGGNSLMAMQLIHRISLDFHLEIPLHVFFGASSVAEMAAEIARRRAELTTSYLSETQVSTITSDPAHLHVPFPLNDVQQAYWIGRQGFYELGNVASHSYVEIDFPELDLERLNLAVNLLIARHDMLRSIVLADGTQQILESVPPYRIEIADLRGAATRGADAHLLTVREEMSHQVLATDCWPLFDIRASQLTGGVRIHFGLDYLIADAWSVGIIFREIFAFYDNPELKLPALEFSFRDWVLAEIAQQSSESHQKAERYWRERLPSLPPAPELPLATSPDALRSPRFVRRARRLNPEVWERVKKLGARAGLTPSGILLGAFSEILTAWSKSPRFTINVTLFNRPPHHPQINELVGDFTSLILLAIDGARATSLGLRARAVQEQLWKDLEHRSFSGVQVLRELTRIQGRPDASIAPVVFTSTLGQNNLHTGAFAAGTEPREQNEPGYSITQTPQVWLDHQIGERDDALVYNWDAVEDLFYPGVLDDMWNAYNSLLESLAEEETWQEMERPWLPKAQLERRRAVNSTEAPVREGLLHSLFEEQAKERPEQAAVIAAGRTLSYQQLERLSSHIGQRLRQLGAQPNKLVAVVMEKGWEQVVAVLAILKSGAAYLPINPALPTERLQHLLREGEVSWVLTQPEVEQRVTWPEDVSRLCVEWSEPSNEVTLVPVQGAGDLAYVIFTSGSTGQPKGVMIDHRGALNTIIDVNTRFQVSAGDRVLALSSLSFDLSVYDIFGILGAGGTIVIPEAGATRDPEHWLELVRREGVTIWNSVPALMEMMEQYVSGQGAGELESLRVVMLSGDWIPLSLPERVKRLSPGAQVISMGGATEASIWSIIHEIKEVGADWASIPYGKPMVNQRFHVLNEMLEECPEWVAGQLYIGGVGLAQGYWRDEEKTRGSFIVHPGSGERLYRTGDMGRYQPDGEIEFLGREDLQVKIQGHRIELGEIEAALEQHAEVQTAVAVAVGKDRTNRRLVAYVVTKNGSENAVEMDNVMAPVTAHDGNGNGHGELLTHDGKQCIELPLVKLETTRGLSSLDQQGFSGEIVGLKNLNALLSCLLQLKLDGPLPKYRYPSAGNLYPVQAYVFIKPARIEGIDGGIYYYHPQNHSLVLVGSETAITPDCFAPEEQAGFEQLDFALFLIARMDAIVPMYDQLSPDFCLLEAGYMGQLLTTTAQENRVELHPLRLVDFDKIRNHFAIDDRHILVHAFAGGSNVQREPSQVVPDVEAPAVMPSAWARMSVVAHSQSNGTARKLTDKIDRLEFKLQAAGLRQPEFGQPAIPLAQPKMDQPFKENFTYRRSDREFLTRSVPLTGLSALLGQISQFHSERIGLLKDLGYLPERYPLQTYVHVKKDRIEGVPGGAYFYDQKHYRLELLKADVELTNAIHADVNRAVFDSSAFSLFLIGDKNAASFNERIRDLCFLEAGYTGQHLMTASPADGIGLCPIGWMDFEFVRPQLNLDSNFILLHSFLGGRIEPRYSTQSGAVDPKQNNAPQPGEQADHLSEELRSFLLQKLPEYMVPMSIIVTHEVPLSSNGKVDRNALAALHGEQHDSTSDYVAPRNPVERQLTEIWYDLLDLKQVSITDNFFAIGGDSIKAIQFLARAKEAGYDFNVRDFFEQPLIVRLAEIARAIETDSLETADTFSDEPAGAGGFSLADFPDAEMSQAELEDLIAQFEPTNDTNPNQ